MKGEREGEKHWCMRDTLMGCLSHAPKWGPDLQPRHVPWLRIEPVTFQLSATFHLLGKFVSSPSLSVCVGLLSWGGSLVGSICVGHAFLSIQLFYVFWLEHLIHLHLRLLSIGSYWLPYLFCLLWIPGFWGLCHSLVVLPSISAGKNGSTLTISGGLAMCTLCPSYPSVLLPPV